MRLLSFFLMSLQLLVIPSLVEAENKSRGVGLKKIVVTGQVPGPDLWKVSKDGNDLWILGTLSPLPKKMDWNSKPIEDVIRTSQAFMSPPSFFFSLKDVGFFQKLSLAKSAFGIKKNPEKEKLIDLIPADIYSRWLVLKKKYIGNSKKIEKTRPIFASNKLYKKALKKTGLTSKTGISKKLRKVAKKSKLEMIYPSIEIDMQDPKTLVKKFKKSEMNDLECFTKTIERIESDLETMSTRANAWSFGDIATIKSLPYVGNGKACDSAIFNSGLAQDMGMEDIRSRLTAVWLDNAKTSLTNHQSTFAVLPISYLLKDAGILSDFEAAGYTIEVPSTIDTSDEMVDDMGSVNSTY